MSQRGVLMATGAGAAISSVMQTQLANATPRIVTELASHSSYGLIAGSYLLCSTLALPLFAQYADRLGPRRIFVFGHICFALGTIALAIAPSMTTLLAARAIQGFGAAAIVPAALAAFGLLFTGKHRGKAVASFAAVQLVAGVIGPPLGGWFTDGPGWRLGVLVVLPLSAIALLLAHRLPTSAAPAHWWRFSPREQLGLITGRLGHIFVLAGLAGVISLGALNYAPLMYQTRLGLDATTAGWALIAMLSTVGLGAFAASALVSYRWVRPACWLVMLAGLPVALFTDPTLATVGLAITGLGTGVIVPLLLVDAQSHVQHQQLAQASALVQLGRQAGAAVGVPALSLWLIWPSLGLPAVFCSLCAAALCGLVLTYKETT